MKRKISINILYVGIALLLLVFGVLVFLRYQIQTKSAFVGDITDCPSITLANHTTQEGTQSACWAESVVGRIGDTINVRINYKNNSESIIREAIAVLGLTKNTSGDAYDITVNLDASNSKSLTYITDIKLNAKGVLEFDGMTSWYPDISVNEQMSFIGDQTHRSLFDESGLLLGDIEPGQSGAVVVSYRVNPEVNPLIPIEADSAVISQEESTTSREVISTENEAEYIVPVVTETSFETESNVVELPKQKEFISASGNPIETIGNTITRDGIEIYVSNGREAVQYTDTIVYEVIAKNTNNYALNNVSLGIKLPEVGLYRASTAGLYNNDNHQHSYSIGQMRPNQIERVLVNIDIDENAGLTPESTRAQVFVSHSDGVIRHLDVDSHFNLDTPGVRAEQMAQSLKSFGYWGTLMGWLSLFFGFVLLVFAVRQIVNMPRPEFAFVAPTMPKFSLTLPRFSRNYKPKKYRGHLGE